MLILAKAALGLCGTMALATVYTFQEGVVRVDVDENFSGGSHVHFWVPAKAVSAGMHVMPRHNLRQAAQQARPYLPLLRQLSKELPKYPNTVFVDVKDNEEHIRIMTVDGKLCIDATQKDELVHVTVPVAVIRDVANNLEEIPTGGV